MSTVEHRDVDVGDGLRLHVAIAGTGTPLVLLHGFTGSSDSWAPLRGQLAAEHTTVSVELPGHGRSTVPDDPARYALPRFADDLLRVLDLLGLARVAMLGYSLGGRAALSFALHHSGRVAALILESASPGIADEAERAQRAAADAALADDIERNGIEAFVARWEALPLWETQRRLPADVRARLRAQRLGNRPRGLAQSLRGSGAAAEASVLSRLGALDVPTLLVVGALDTKYVALGEQMAGTIPGARLAVVDGAGHAVHLERPAALAALVLEFLRGV